MSRLKAALAVLLLLGLGGCGVTFNRSSDHVSYQHRPVSFSPAAARDWLTQYRESRGLGAVALDSRLTAFAQSQANAMAANSQLSHSIGGSFSSRVKASGLDDSRIGENISFGTYTDRDAMLQWKNSPEHNANLLMPSATRFGIAIARGGDRVYWAMAVAGNPVRAEDSAQVFGQGPTVRVVRRKPPQSRGIFDSGLFGN